MTPATHTVGIIANAAPVTIPIQRTPAMDWPGDGALAFVPAALLLAARGRCSCSACIDGFVHTVRRSRLRSV